VTAVVLRGDAPTPYYSDDRVTLYHGDCREILPGLGVAADCVIADPPYGETSLVWDSWPDGWIDVTAEITSSMWCFGSLRMFLERHSEFDQWRLSQDVVWEKNTGTGFATDRFARVHEHALHWYRGNWASIHHEVPRIKIGNLRRVATKPAGAARAAHLGEINHTAAWVDDGTRLTHSVLRVRGMHRRGTHPTEKPVGILDPLIRYACPSNGLVMDPFAGSGSTLDAARAAGRHAIGVEIDERYCKIAARRLSQGVLDFAEVTG
jgi:site-specific DNA-methyltransferase (adenine-specific)